MQHPWEHKWTVFSALSSVPVNVHITTQHLISGDWLYLFSLNSGLSQPADFITLHSCEGGPARSKSRSIIGQGGTGFASEQAGSPPEQRTSTLRDAVSANTGRLHWLWKATVNSNSTLDQITIFSLFRICLYLNLGDKILTIINRFYKNTIT